MLGACYNWGWWRYCWHKLSVLLLKKISCSSIWVRLVAHFCPDIYVWLINIQIWVRQLGTILRLSSRGTINGCLIGVPEGYSICKWIYLFLITTSYSSFCTVLDFRLPFHTWAFSFPANFFTATLHCFIQVGSSSWNLKSGWHNARNQKNYSDRKRIRAKWLFNK